MDTARRRRIFQLLREALDLPPAQQPDWLAANADDGEMARAVIALIDESPEARALDEGLAALETTADDADIAIGIRLGAWRILRLLGRGGMGTVYLAEREGDDFRQSGALKLIKRGMDSQEVIDGFRRERRILAQLRHPHVARLLDGGIATDGRPWLVMEHVDGEPLLDWAGRRDAGIDERARLFLQVAEAVAAAHRQLIVHCDIKPGNVLVDANGDARLLDFGIAKIVDSDHGRDRRRTSNARFLSRAYAAPEQLDDEPVTTVTDVFQLGLLLAELLSGLAPGRLQELAATRPTLRLAQAREAAGASGPSAIHARELRGDAGIIISRACDPEPTRRYASVTALADDVRRWRHGLPIHARPDSTSYRIGRFVNRHRLGTAMAALAIVALLATTAFAVRQARRAAHEASVAGATQGFLAGIFDAAAPDTAKGHSVTARELLDLGSERIRNAYPDQPELRAELQLTLARLYRQLGQFDQAAKLLADASHHAGSPSDATLPLRIATEAAVVERELGRFDASRSRFDSIAVSAIDDPALRSRVLLERGGLKERQGAFDDALADVRAAIAIDTARGDIGHADLVRDWLMEGLLLIRLGRFDEAHPVYDKALDAAVALYGEDDTRVANAQADLGQLLTNQSRPGNAEALLQRALATRRNRFGNEHPAVAETLQVLGSAQRQQGRFDDAERSYAEALRIQQRVLPANHPDIIATNNSLAVLALGRQQYAIADRYLSAAIAINNSVGQGSTTSNAMMMANRAMALTRTGRNRDARLLFEQALAILQGAVGETHPAVMAALNGLAQLQLREGKLADAERNVRESLRIAEALIGPGRDHAGIRTTLANVLLRADKIDEALREAREALSMFDAAGGASDPRRAGAVAIVADALIAAGRLDEARELVREVVQARTASATTAPAGMVGALALAARFADAGGDAAQARDARRRASAIVADMVDPDPELRADLARTAGLR